MLPFFNMRLNRNYNMAILQPFIDKMKRGELTLENILEEDEIIQDLKTNQNSQFIYFLSNEHIRKLIDYATKMPKSNDKNVGYKYPFNATEILCCDNNAVMEKIMNEIHLGGDSDEEEDEKENKEEEKEENSEEKKEENEEFVEVKEDENKEKEAIPEPSQPQEQIKPPEQNEEKPEEVEKNEASEPPKEKEVKEEEPKNEEPKKEEEQNPEEEKKEKAEEPPKAEEKVEEPKKEEPPKTEEKVEEPKKEEPPKTEGEQKPEEEKKEEAQKPEEKAEEPKKEEPLKPEEEQPKDEPTKEEPKAEELNKKEGEMQEEAGNKQENEEEPKQEPEVQGNEEEHEPEQEKDEEQEKDDEEQGKEYTVIYDNVDYLLGFLNESEETKSNYVLVGYFYKILNHLFNSQSSKIVQYIFDYPKKNEFDVLGLIVKNMKRKSMGEIVNKLLLFQEEGGDDFLPKRLELLEKVLEELKETTEEDKYECICSTLESTFYNKAFFLEFMKDPKYLDMMYTILEKSQGQSRKLVAVLKLFINIHENILKNEDKRSTVSVAQENPMDFLSLFNGGYGLEETSQKEANPEVEQIVDKVFTNLITLIDKNNFNFLNDLDDYSQPENSEFMTTYQKKQKRLGMKKLSQIEFFRTILDILVNAYAKYKAQPIGESIINIINKAQKKKLFWKMHKLFFDFPFCNLYQTFYSQILDIILNENSPESLIKYTFIEEEGEEKKNLLQIFIDKTINEMQFKFQSGRIAFNPNYSFQVSILNKVIESTNPYMKELIKDNQNLAAFDTILGKEIDTIFKQKLLLSGDKDIQLGPSIPLMSKEEDLKYFGKKNFMEILEEDNQIYRIYTEGGDYEKLLNAKKEREKKEQEERKKSEEEANEAGEEEQEEPNVQIGLGDSINNFDDGEQEKEVKKDEDEFKEKLDSGTEEPSEETEEDKSFNDVNFWKPSITPDDNIMNAFLTDLD